VASATTSGATAPITSSTAFISATVNVTVAAGQKVLVVSSAGLGAGVTAATSLNLYICYSTGGPLTTVGGGIFGLTAPANSRQLYDLNTVIFSLAPNTYTVGLCGSSAVPANWNNNEWSYTSALVFN